MKLYRLLTGPDDAEFCKRVTAALNDGWELHGSPTVSFDSAQGRTICAQAVVKFQPGEYDPEKKLTEQG